MQTYPYPLRNRPELNLRHAIKSSIPEIRQLIALTIAVYLSKRESKVEYGYKEGKKLLIRTDVFASLTEYFSEQIDLHDQTEFADILDQNPLCKAQMEPLQVALELFLKLCKVSFPDGAAGSSERTGSDRYIKVLHFTTNAEIIRLAFEKNEDDLKWILFDWLVSGEPQQESETSLRLKRLLTIFSEETQFRLREEDHNELFFQQEGVYKALLEGNTVVAQDVHENVGPFRILKSYVSAALHPFLQGDKQSAISHKQFVLNPQADESELNEYAGLVRNYLDVLPKRTTVTVFEDDTEDDEHLPDTIQPLLDLPKNCILFGPPGTGKSSRIKGNYAKGHEKYRVTFHPDYEYASFVGSYKPFTDVSGDIHYKFVEQEFIRAYTRAWNDPERAHFLIIEEINRGNCAQIFGDIFQCLDRYADGFSEYEVDADTDLTNFLQTFFDANPIAARRLNEQLRRHDCPANSFGKLILPNNLYLYATMNTSDQSLFPMDSAFKRRWDWEYVPIDYAPVDDAGQLIEITIDLGDAGQYSWAEFLKQANRRIYDTIQNEDKQLGFWFVKADSNQTIQKGDFKAKVLFYLWYEVYRNEQSDALFPVNVLRNGQNEPFSYGMLFDKELETSLLTGIMETLGVPVLTPNSIPAA